MIVYILPKDSSRSNMAKDLTCIDKKDRLYYIKIYTIINKRLDKYQRKVYNACVKERRTYGTIY